MERIVIGISDVTSAVLESGFHGWSGAAVSLIEGKISSIDTCSLHISRISGSFPEGRYWFLLLRSILKVSDPKIRYQRIARYVEFLRQMGLVDSLSLGLQYLGDLYIRPDSVRPPTASNQSQTITIPQDF